MDTIDKILNLMDNAGVSAYQLSKEAKISNGLITQWKQHKQNPSVKNLKKIARYFNVPWESLMADERQLTLDDALERLNSATDNERSAFVEYFNKSEVGYINKLRCLNYKGTQRVLAYIDDLYGNPEYRADKNNS